MPSDYYLGYYFYAPTGRFEPCGMFTYGHIISAIICLIIVSITAALHIKRNGDNQKIIRKLAVIITILEIIKIAHSFIYGELHIDAWFPLSYCGLFIFALWMAGFGKSRFKDAGYAFIAYGCPIAGIAFIIFPTTSLMSFPIWHYFSLYSLFFHSAMIFMGISLLAQVKRLSKESYINYAVYVLIFGIIAIIMNSVFGCNLMNLREPYNIPIQFLQDLHTANQWLYTGVTLFAYVVLIPPIICFISGKLKPNNKQMVSPL